MHAFDELSPVGRDLLSALLAVDEGSRMSVEDALQHPWFHEVRPSCHDLPATFLNPDGVAG